MSTSEPIHVAFVWHMHQPYYRSARTGAFHMPWARLHALKDYLDMVEVLADYPTIHQTFNMVPSLVEQLEDYASGGAAGEAGGGALSGAAGRAADVYWEHTVKPAIELTPTERAFVVERMCERSDHPRAKSHPRYFELAQKRESETCRGQPAREGWEACAALFSVNELRDLQMWFNLAWFDSTLLEAPPLADLVQHGRDYREEDKLVLAQVQSDILARVIPAYRDAAARGQIELSTSPYFHPILPLLVNSDAARVGAGDTVLPRRRFAHPEDAWEQVDRGIAYHERVFGTRPRGMWCSEQAVGEDVLPLLMRAGIEWTISDQSVLSRSLSGSAAGGAAGRGGVGRGPAETTGGAERGDAERAGVTEPAAGSPYVPYLLHREKGEAAGVGAGAGDPAGPGEMTIVFRDHTLSDLIGFGYQSWDSRHAANDLLSRIRAIGESLSADSSGQRPAGAKRVPLITIALDGENAWEYYPHDGRDFLRYLYEGLAADPEIRCVTISEHLGGNPATEALDWLHTGSWIGGDLRTWSGDPGHNAAWELLHDARDLAATRRAAAAHSGPQPLAEAPTDPGAAGGAAAGSAAPEVDRIEAAEAAWSHILAAEGSDWFWWFGEHHHTELDHAWDLEFRQHLQEVYRRLGEPIPIRLYLPVLAAAPSARPAAPAGTIEPTIDGRLTEADGWDAAGRLLPDHPSTMQRADGTHIVEARWGWGGDRLYLLVIPRDAADLEGLELELRVAPAGGQDESVFHMAVAAAGAMEVSCNHRGHLAGTAVGAWSDVVEIALPLTGPTLAGDNRLGLVLRAGRGGMTDYLFRSTDLASLGEAGS